MASARLAGHGLPQEGRIWDGYRFGNGAGPTRCSCGAGSPMLPNTAARKRWHREHKQRVREELENGGTT